MQRWYSLLLPHSARSIAWLAILTVFAIGFLALVGWLMDITLLKSVRSEWITMRVITAACLVLSAMELTLLQISPSNLRRFMVLQAPAMLVGLVGLLTTVFYSVAMITSREPPLGSAPFLNLLWALEHRMALLTAILFIVSGCALMLLASGSRRAANIAHALMLPGAMVSYLVPVSYLLGVQALQGWLGVPVALNTGIAFCALSVAIFCIRPDTWLMSVFTGDHAGGVMARRLFPVLLLIPLLIARLHLYLEGTGALVTELNVALEAIIGTFCLLCIVWLTAASLNRADSHRSQAEEEVKHMSSFPQLNPNPVLEIDKSGKVIFSNPATGETLARLGVPLEPEAFLPQNLLEILTALREKKDRQDYREVQVGAATFGVKLYWVPQFETFRAFASDITERQRAEEALRQSEARERNRASELQGVLDAVPTPIFMAHGLDARVITGNPAAYKLLHLPPGSNVSKIAPEDERPGFKAIKDGQELPVQELPMQQAIVGQTVDNFEYDLILEDGAIRHVSANAVPLFDEAGRPRGAVAAIVDLTERKQGQEALRRSRDELEERVQERTAQVRQQAELIQDLYNNAPCGYHSLDPDGTIVQINQTELDWLGYRRDEVVGRMKFSDILTPDSLNIFQKNFRDFRERGWVHDLEYEMVRKNGTLLPVLLSATAIKDEAGNYLMSRSTVYDISARKRADNAVKESEARLRYLASRLLTAQEDVRKRIAWELHDDLGQSLTALKLQIRSLQRGFPAEMSEAKAESAAILNYINEIVEKVRSIAYNLRPGVLDLGLTAALNSLLRELLIDQNMELSMDLCPMDGLFPSEEEISIYRVFQEALTNIVKHAQANRVVLTAKKQEGSMAFQIDDNGQGFDLEEVQGRGAQDRRLGLATMEERVRLLGGSLKISSVKGLGTSIAFSIPIGPLQKRVK